MKQKIFINRITGISDYDKESLDPYSVAFTRRIDFRTDPKRWTLNPKTQKESGTVVLGLPKWGDRVGDNTYVIDDAGNIYKRTLAGVVSLGHTASDSHGNGLKYFGEDDFLYYPNDKVIGRYGPVSGTPTWVDDFLGAEGGVPLNTHSLDLEASSSQYATAADSASLSITGDITLEANVKAESLPAAGADMGIISKWNGNSDERSYMMSVYGISGYFGDGSDGTLTISSNTTEAPIDSTASGTSGAYTLTATNASFATDQEVLIHQSRGTGAGTWQRNRITGYTAGTITLQNALNFSYATGAQVRVLKEYTTVTINTGITYTTKAWNGTVGGIIGFICSGTVTVTGTITANGGNGGSTTSGYTTVTDEGGFRGGKGEASSSYPTSGFCGEGTSGASAEQTTANGNGGGGGRINSADVSHGAAGGHATVGSNGGSSGGQPIATGGGISGSADLTTMTFGGAGGGGAKDSGAGNGTTGGGNGGGIVTIIGATVVVTGAVSANGGSASAPYSFTGQGGPGAGGSILIESQTATLGSGLVTANTGTGATSGSAGRIHLNYYTSYTGTTSPTLSVSQDSNLVTNTVYHLRLYISNDGTAGETYTKEMTSYTTGVWKHLAVAWDASASTAYFYEEGTLLGQATGAMTSIYNSTALLGIGADFSPAGAARDFFDGLIDNARVWNDIRTVAEITAYKGQETIGSEANLQASYQVDNAATDGTANANNLTLVNTPVYSTDVPFSAPTTRLDIDQSDSSSGSTYSIPTTIDEGTTARQSFVPAKDPQKSIQVNISAKGTTADWTLTVHDVQNRSIATKTVANADLNTGNFEFTFATAWRPVIGKTYHFHLTATNTTGTPAAVAGTSGNLETAPFTSYYQFLVTDTKYHPVEQILTKFGIGNGRYLATWDGTTYNPHELTFPSGWSIRCLAPWREYLAIGCVKGTNIEDYDQGMIFFWDGASDTYNFYLNMPEGGVNAMLGSQGVLYIIAGYKGDLLEYRGGEKANKVKRLKGLGVGEQIEVLPGAMTMWQTLLRIGAGVTDSATLEQGVYSWGALNKNYPDGLSYDHTISTGNSQSTGVQIGLVLPVGEKLLIGWKDNLSYGLDVVDQTADPYESGSIDFLIRDENAVWKEKMIDLIRADFEPLATSESMGLQYKLDRESTWSTISTASTALDNKLRLQAENSRHKEFQIRLTLGTTTTTSPACLGVTVVQDTLEEKYI